MAEGGRPRSFPLQSAMLLVLVAAMSVAAGAPDRPSLAAQEADASGATIYLTFLGRYIELVALDVPSPATPSLPLPGPTPSAGVPFTPSPESPTPSVPTPTATVPQCRVGLANRIVVRQIALDAEHTIQQPRRSGWWTHYPIVTAPLDDRIAWVGWSAPSSVRYTPVLGLGRRAGPDVVLPGESTHGAVAHADGGAAALVRRGRIMTLVRWSAQGSILFQTDIVGADGSGAGAKWIDDWPHEGRLAWDGAIYAAYFGHTQNWGAEGRHQGDLLWHFGADGSRLEDDEMTASRHPWWNWGCSHSIDLRMILHPTLGRLGTVCLSDAYPAPGVVFERQLLISQEPSADGNGNVDAALGGIAPAADGFAVNYVSKEGRRSQDVALRRVYDEDNEVGPPWWLTNTPEEDELSAHLASYGTHLLAGWSTQQGHQLAIVTQRGVILEGPVSVEARIHPRDDFVNYPNGDVGWAYSDSSGSNLWNARVQLCEQTPANP